MRNFLELAAILVAIIVSPIITYLVGVGLFSFIIWEWVDPTIFGIRVAASLGFIILLAGCVLLAIEEL